MIHDVRRFERFVRLTGGRREIAIAALSWLCTVEARARGEHERDGVRLVDENPFREAFERSALAHNFH